jgi:uncharacterized protein YjiS (DUF1127 family)
MTTFTDRISQGIFETLPRASSSRFGWRAAIATVDKTVMALLDWQERARQRRQLLSLDTAALKDFGRSRADAAGEGDKPFWLLK